MGGSRQQSPPIFRGVILLIMLGLFFAPRQVAARLGLGGDAISGLAGGANHAQGEQGKHEDKGTLKDLLMAAMQAAQMAAALAAMNKNKDRNEKLKAADPVQTPAIPAAADTAKPEASSAPTMPGLEREEKAEASPFPEPTANADPAPDPVTTTDATATPAPVETTMAGPPENPSNIPNTIDRTKIGYDETNKAGKNDAANTAAQANYTPTNGNKGASPNMGDLGNKSSLLATELNTVENRYAKNVTAPETDGSGGAGSEHGGTGTGLSEVSEPNDVMAMLNSLMGKGEGAEGMASSQNGATLDSGATFSPRGAIPDKENIFQYASYRYRKLAYEEDEIRRDGTSVAGAEDAKPVFANSPH